MIHPEKMMLVNCDDISTLRKLTSEILIVTDVSLMRGVDYRSKNNQGIELLIAHQLSSNREYRRSLGRVGRYGEDCARYYLDSLTMETVVDRVKSLRIAGKITIM